MAARLNMFRRWRLLVLLVASIAASSPAFAQPMIDAHSHLPNLEVLDSLIAAMKRHNVSKVALLGVGAVQNPVVIHGELDDAAIKRLEQALRGHPKSTIILAHGGSAEPGRIESLLLGHQNLRVDLSGMHFMRSPSLASGKEPLDASWKTLLEKMPDRFLIGIDVWASQLFKPETLDRLMIWTRRVLGELRADAAEQIAYKNAARLFRVE